MSGRVSVRRVYVWSGKCPSGICHRVSVGRVYVQSGKCPVTKTTPKHPRGAVFLADYDSMAHPG